ncbi:MAG: hypothetical protein JWN73_4940 [Betaproteobacteria bacterium]|nr:hypothetical protein [Betaproteobacteria bacterium]
MKTITKILAATGLALAAVSGSAMARPHIGISIGVPGPYYAPRPYYAPAPYYGAPAYYSAPAPYYAPAPVYGPPAVVYGGGYGYYGPRYYGRGYYGPHGHWHR